jgi:hypothetical protein
VVPSSFRIARMLLERIDAADTGIVKHSAFHAQIPPERAAQARRAAEVLGEEIWRKFPFTPGGQPMQADLADLVLNRTWRPVPRGDRRRRLPAPANAGNVLRPLTKLVLSLRLPPTVKAESAAKQLKAILETDPPYGARVTFESGHAGTGWHAPQTAPWLEKVLNESSNKHFGKPAMWMGEGGTIPFMGMLGRAVSAGAVPDHRGIGAALECARPERVPAYRLREAPDGVRGDVLAAHAAK